MEVGRREKYGVMRRSLDTGLMYSFSVGAWCLFTIQDSHFRLA